MDVKHVIVSAVAIVTAITREINDNDEIKSFVCGNYSDGRPRSLSDAVAGEYLSPKDKKKMKGGKKSKDKYKKKYKKLKKKTKKQDKRKRKYAKKYKYTI